MENTKVYVLLNGFGGVTHASTSLDEVLSYFKVEDYDLNNPEDYHNLTHSHILAFDKTGVVDESYVYVKSLNKICRVNWDMEVVDEEVKTDIHHSSELRVRFTYKDGSRCEVEIPKDYKDNPTGYIETVLKSCDEIVKGEFLDIHTYRHVYGEFLK